MAWTVYSAGSEESGKSFSFNEGSPEDKIGGFS